MGLASARGREKDHAKVTSAFARCRDQRRCEYKRLNPTGNTDRVGDKDSLGQITLQGREQELFPFPAFPYMPFPYQICADVHDRQDHLLKWHNQPNRNQGLL